MSNKDGRWIDQKVWMPQTPGTPIDLGWGVAILNKDNTLTRTCKDCGASLTGPIVVRGQVAIVVPQPFTHTSDCKIWPRLGNNPEMS